VLEETCSESIELLSKDMQYIRFILSLIDVLTLSRVSHWSSRPLVFFGR